VSDLSAPVTEPEFPRHGGLPPPVPPGGPARPLVMAGGVAALAAASGGLAALVTLTAIGWITAPHVGLGGGLSGVLRSAGELWLVAHHVAVTVRGVGRIGLLPLGLVLLPGALIERAGRWMANAGHVRQPRDVVYAAAAIAFPYALLTGAVAVASRTQEASSSAWQAVWSGFLLAVAAGGFGAARGLAPWRRLTALLPPRPRSVLLGSVAALAMLTAFGALLAGTSLTVHLHAYREAVASLSPGAGGSALLLLAGISYLPNSVIWAIAYMLGPGFSVGVGTAVSPSGSALGAIPAFPMLAGLPVGARAAFPPWLGFFVLALPYLAGALAGVVTVRIAPTPFLEAAPFWGLLSGSLAGVVIGFGAKFSGGPLGAGRLASVGPAGAEVGLVAVLEVGVTAAVVAGAANWLVLRYHIRRLAAAAAPASQAGAEGSAVLAVAAVSDHTAASPVSARVVDETDTAGGHKIFYDAWASERDNDPDAE
jgi:uncharacterized protein DUF6350